MRDHVPDVVREALDATGLPWTLEDGSRHTKIKLAGRLVGILNRQERDVGRGRKAQLNTVRQIKAMAREIQLTR